MSQYSNSSSRLLAAAVAGFVMIASVPAHAWEGQISFTTWLRAGPGRAYAVVDEVWGGDLLQIGACGNGWCSTLTGGKVAYIEQGLVTQTTTPVKPPAPTTRDGCFEGNRAGYGKGETEIYCPAPARP